MLYFQPACIACYDTGHIQLGVNDCMDRQLVDEVCNDKGTMIKHALIKFSAKCFEKV